MRQLIYVFKNIYIENIYKLIFCGSLFNNFYSSNLSNKKFLEIIVNY